MSITLQCPHCNGTIAAGEHLLGKQARCPFCKQTVKVERPSAAPARVPAPPAQKPDRPRAHKPNGELPPLPPLAIQREDPSSAAEPSQAVPPAAANKDQDQQTGPAGTAQEPAGPTGIVLGSAGQHRRKKNFLVVLGKSLIRQGNPTDVSVLLSGLLAAGLTWLAYAVVIEPLRSTDVGQLLAERGWVAYATFYFTVWAAVTLSIKFWKIGKQRASLYYDLLPVNRAVKITPGNVDLVEHHLRRLPLHPRKSFLINRLLMALENFKARKSVPEVGAVLNAQADTDAAMVDSSYAMLKVLIWAIPILGFIGTVIGISEAVNHFTGGVSQAGKIDEVKTALSGVTRGLAVAFDTTLLGLILSMVIMFPTGWIQKAEEDLLSSIDQYCNENLLPRLATDAEAAPEQAQRQADAQAQTLEEWQRRLEKLEVALLEKVMDTLAQVREELVNRDPASDKPAKVKV
jgi:biopolymer transport protein ExbB/TolQ